VDLTYVGMSDEGYEQFHLLADGNRPVLNVMIDATDAIWVSALDDGVAINVPQRTKGVVHRHTDADLEASGIDSSHVCLGAVASYVVPRAVTLMARVYCPVQTQEVSE
jgi:hypothetical protein